MHDYSMVSACLQLGGVVRSCVDTATGELLPVARTGREEDRARLYLSKAQICTREGEVNYWLGGSLITCKKPMPKSEQVKRGSRKAITFFTRRSRLNLMYTIGKISKGVMPHFVTLTYPSEWSENSRKWKNDLRKLYQRIKRKVPGVCAVWKLEPQERGAPHFHLLVWGLQGILLGDLQWWVARLWYEVVGSGDKNHLLWHLGKLGNGNKPCVQAVDNWRQVMAYVSKYLGKLVDSVDWDKPGRFWGVLGRDNIPWADLVRVAVSYPEAVKLLRLMRRKIKTKRGNLPSLSMLCNNPEYWFDRHERLTT